MLSNFLRFSETESSPGDLQSSVPQLQTMQQTESKLAKGSEKRDLINERSVKSVGSKIKRAKRSVSEKSLRRPESRSSRSTELRTTFSESKISDLAAWKPADKTTQTPLNFRERANPPRSYFEPEDKVTQTTSSLGKLILRSKATLCDADSQDGVPASLRFEEHVSSPVLLDRGSKSKSKVFSEPVPPSFVESPSSAPTSRSRQSVKNPSSKTSLARSSSRLTGSGSALFCPPTIHLDQENRTDETVVTPVVRLLILQLEEMEQTYDTYAQIMRTGDCLGVNDTTRRERCFEGTGKHHVDKHLISRVVKSANRPLLSADNIILRKFPTVNPNDILSKGDVNILMREFERMVDSYNYFASMLSKICCRKDCKMDLGRKRVDFRIVKPPKLTHGDVKVLLGAFERMLAAYERFTESLTCKDPETCQAGKRKLEKNDRKSKGEGKYDHQEKFKKFDKKKRSRQRGGQHEYQTRDPFKSRDQNLLSRESSSDYIPCSDSHDGWDQQKFCPQITKSRCRQCYTVLKRDSVDALNHKMLSCAGLDSDPHVDLRAPIRGFNTNSFAQGTLNHERQVYQIPFPDSCKLVFNVPEKQQVAYFFEFGRVDQF